MLCNPGFLILIQNAACALVLYPVGLPNNISLFEQISSDQQQRCWEKSSTFRWHPSVLATGSPWQQHSFPSASAEMSHSPTPLEPQCLGQKVVATNASRLPFHNLSPKTPPVLKEYPPFLNSENYLFPNLPSDFPHLAHNTPLYPIPGMILSDFRPPSDIPTIFPS